MVFWHLGATWFLFRWIFRDPQVDLRFLLLGSLLPDLVDMPLGTLLFADRYASGRLWTHSLLAPTLVGLVVLVATRRGPSRKRGMALVIGMMFHLLLDGMWTQTSVFLWPFAGQLPAGPRPYWSTAIQRALDDPWRWLRETAGVIYLFWLLRPAGVMASVRSVAGQGRLPDPAR